MPTVGLIANPAAGSGAAVSAAGRLSGLLQEAGVKTEIVVPANREETALRAANLASSNELLVALGGDGTANLVMNACLEADIPFALFPAGTGDDNACSLGVATDMTALVKQILDFFAGAIAPQRVDVGMASWGGGKQRAFLGVMSTGFDSSVNERANASTRFSGTARYIGALLAELRLMEPVTYRVTVDEQVLETPAILASVGNGSRYGGGMRVCPGADMTDGILDVTVLAEVSRLTFLRVFPRVFKGTHISHPAVTTLRGSRVSIAAPGAIAYGDGERFGPLPVTVEVRAKALQVIGARAA